MKLLKGIFNLYYEGFRNMKVGKKLWLIIGIKLLVIFTLLKFVIYDKNLTTEYKTQEQKTNFVLENLLHSKN